ncbi:MAG TPA: hypothetical protein VGY49_00550 [Burkholderiaceae bacterium]|jgi:hypothetical protein|nr:hypothetical protein [Burkholderiaceae bacterium]
MSAFKILDLMVLLQPGCVERAGSIDPTLCRASITTFQVCQQNSAVFIDKIDGTSPDELKILRQQLAEALEVVNQALWNKTSVGQTGAES